MKIEANGIEKTPSTNSADEILINSLKEKEDELDMMLKKEDEAKKKEKALKPMINKTNKMILCAVIFGLLVIACMAIPAGLGLAAVAIATAGVGAYGLANAVKGGMKSFKPDPIKEANKKVRDAKIKKITDDLEKDTDGNESEQNNPVPKNNTSQDLAKIVYELVEVNKKELEKIKEEILKNAKEVLGEDFQIIDGTGASKALFEGDSFEKFIENLSKGLRADHRNISQEGVVKGQGELFKEFVKAYEELREDELSEKKLRLNALKDIFKEWGAPDSEGAGESKKEAAKNMLNSSLKGVENNDILKPAILKLEKKVNPQTSARSQGGARNV